MTATADTVSKYKCELCQDGADFPWSMTIFLTDFPFAKCGFCHQPISADKVQARLAKRRAYDREVKKRLEGLGSFDDFVGQ